MEDENFTKLKILALHGHATNPEFMKNQMKLYEKIFEDTVEFTFLQGWCKFPEKVKILSPEFLSDDEIYGFCDIRAVVDCHTLDYDKGVA